MIKNIIFDMGQVLIKFDKEYFLDFYGVKDPADRKLILNNVYNTPEWPRMDRGSLKAEEALAIMLKRLPDRLHDVARKIVISWYDDLVVFDDVGDIVKELKAAGYKIYLLSNAGFDQINYWNKISCSKYFDGRVVSAEEGIVKPQPEIYRLICDRYSLVPEECVFIDDSSANAEGAYYCGMHPIVYHGDADELRKRLTEFGVKIKD